MTWTDHVTLFLTGARLVISLGHECILLGSVLLDNLASDL